jgi:hypothetical protein
MILDKKIFEEVKRFNLISSYSPKKTLSENINEQNNQDNDIDFLNYGDLDENSKEKVKSFIKNLQERCDENGINILITNTKGIPYVTDSGLMVNGYFDEDAKILACAAGKDISQWLTILIHESSHMEQFMEGVPEWTNNLGLNETDKWLSGNDVDMKKVTDEIKTSIQVELDCEKRTIKKIKKWGLDNIVDTDEYIQKANAYIMFYLWMKENRKWYEIGREPYNLPEIFKEMPKTFDNDYSELSMEIMAVLDKLKESPKK